jgi:nicotinamide-nucleotide amidase
MRPVAEPSGPAGIVSLLAARGLTLATAESLTAGLVAATLADVPGCSAVLQGGVVAYQVGIKRTVLGVPEDALAAGVVSESVARAMAEAARRVLDSDIGIGTTGVAGPDPHEGAPVGSVWIAVAAAGGTRSRHLVLSGDRTQIRRQTVAACWELLAEMLVERE